VSSFQPVRFGKYLLIEKIAAGSLTELFRAKIIGVQGFEKPIAVKRLLPSLTSETKLVRAFIDEANLAALLNHQNIIQIYDFGSIDSSHFIAMEYLFGKDLRMITQKSVEENVSFPLEYSFHITSKICAGLDYAHKIKDFQGNSLNLVHRDISPQNIIITYEGDVKLVDFGIARAATQSTKTQVGMIKGKVAYMSPEQAEGKQIDHRSDIFATGILFYEMVTGRRMFEGDTLHMLSKVRSADYTPAENFVQNLPPKVYEILHHALSRDPENRYQSCGEMLADLEECIYERGFKPNPRELSKYMNMLFAQEIDAELRQMHDDTRENSGQVEPEPEHADEIDAAATEKLISITDTDDDVPKRKKPVAFFAAMGGILLLVAMIFALWPGEKSSERVGDARDSRVTVAVPGQTERSGEAEFEKDVVSDEMSRVEKETALQEKVSPEKPQAVVADKTVLQEAIGGTPGLETAPADEETMFAKLAEANEALEDKNFPRAIELFEELLVSRPELMDAIAEPYSRSLEAQAVSWMAEDPQRSKTLLLKAVEVNPVSVNGHSQLGYLFMKEKNYSKAIEYYEIAAALKPDMPDTFFNLGYIYAVTRRYQNAETMYQLAVELKPGYLDEALFNLAVVQDKQGKRTESLANLKQSLKINPKNEKSKRYLQKFTRKPREVR
jgi:serine/threonine protein kinase